MLLQQTGQARIQAVEWERKRQNRQTVGGRRAVKAEKRRHTHEYFFPHGDEASLET